MDTGSHGAVPLEALLAESVWLRRLATSLVRDPAAAEDLVQETWLAALKNPPAADRPLRPWLRTVLENFVRMRARAEQSRTSRERREARDEATQGEIELVDRVEEQRFLAREVLKLEEPFRSTLVLRYYEGLSSIQIAERVGSNDNTVRWRLKRGLELLRERLDRRHGGDRAAWLALLAPLTPAEFAPTTAGAGGKALGGGATSAWLAAGAAVLALVVAVWFAVREPSGSLGLDAQAPGTAHSAAGLGDEGQLEVERREAPSGPVRDQLAAARVRARLVNAEGEPLKEVQALLELTSGGGPSARTGADGAVELEVDGVAVLASSDALELSATGYQTLRVHAPVHPGATLELGELRLRRASTILGEAQDARGDPIEGAEVRLERLGESFGALREPPLTEILLTGAGLERNAPVRVECDAHGRFRFDGLAEGFYRVWIHADGFARQCSAPVGLLEDDLVAFAPFRLEPTIRERTVRGVVVDALGAPVAGVRVVGQRSSLGREFEWSDGGVRATSDALGRFTLAAEPGKPYRFAATDRARFAVGEQRVGDGGELRLELRDWPTLELGLGGEPHGELALEILGATNSDEVAPFTWVCADGAIGVRIERLAPFSLHVTRGSFAYDTPMLDPQRLPTRIELGAPVPQTLDVQVVAHGEPVVGAQVTLKVRPAPMGWSSLPLSATTDGAGLATVMWSGSGIDMLEVRAEGWATESLRLNAFVGARLEVELVRGGELTGVVRDHRGQVVRGALVTAFEEDGSELQSRTGFDGGYRFVGLRPGSWNVIASAPQVSRRPIGTRAFAGFELGVDGTVEVLDGQTTTRDLQLPEPPACVLRGQVVLDGRTHGPRIVELARPGEARALLRVWSDPSGAFEFAAPWPGDYELRCDSLAEGGSRSEVRQRVTLVRGATEFRLELPSALLIVVLDAKLAPEHELVVVVSTPPDGVWTAYARFDAEGRARARIPAGRCRFAVEGVDHPEMELDLRAGETRELSWPPR